MWTINLPNQAQNEAFLANLPNDLSYKAHHQTAQEEPVAGYFNDVQRVEIGKGASDFEAAKLALQQWAQYPKSWTKILAENAPLTVDNKVGVYFKFFGIWWQNACKILYTIEEKNRYGFAYGTLERHFEQGEELFLLELAEDGTVFYTIKAFSLPNHPLSWIGMPMVRWMQYRFRRDSVVAMQTFVQHKSEISCTFTPTFQASAFVLLAIFWGLLWKGTLLHHEYGKLVLSFFSFVTFPLLIQVFRKFELLPLKFWNFTQKFYLWIALLLSTSFLSDATLWAKLLVLPYIFFGFWAMFLGIMHFYKSAKNTYFKLNFLAICGFFTIALSWLFADRWGLNPMGFGAEIVRLTALHFHYAGLVLPVIASVLTLQNPTKLAIWGNFMVLCGIPATAFGITATHFGFPLWIETVAAVCMSLGGFLTAFTLFQCYKREGGKWLLWAGLVLLFTMLLSLNYALRWFMPHLDIAWMRALHGSCNAFFFATFGLIALLKLKN